MTPPPTTRAVLVTRLSVAQARLRSVDAPVADAIPGELVEVAQETGTRTEALDERTRLRVEIGQLSRAIDRFDRKVYGRCLACGEQINRKRLRAMPEAERCLYCQQAAERALAAAPSDPDDA